MVTKYWLFANDITNLPPFLKQRKTETASSLCSSREYQPAVGTIKFNRSSSVYVIRRQKDRRSLIFRKDRSKYVFSFLSSLLFTTQINVQFTIWLIIGYFKRQINSFSYTIFLILIVCVCLWLLKYPAPVVLNRWSFGGCRMSLWIWRCGQPLPTSNFDNYTVLSKLHQKGLDASPIMW